MSSHINLFKTKLNHSGDRGLLHRRRVSVEIRRSQRLIALQMQRDTSAVSMEIDEPPKANHQPKVQPKLADLDTLLGAIDMHAVAGGLQEGHLSAMRKLCELVYLSDEDAQIDELQQRGVFARIQCYLSVPAVQHAAAAALTQLTLGKAQHVEHLLDNDHRLVSTIVELLANPMQEAAGKEEDKLMLDFELLCIVANVIGRNELYAQWFVQAGIMEPLQALCFRTNIGVNIHELVSLIITGLCSFRFEGWLSTVVIPAVPALCQLMRHAVNGDHDLLFNSTCAVCYITEHINKEPDERNGAINVIFSEGVAEQLLELLTHRYNSVVTASLQALENITESGYNNSQRLIEAGLLTSLKTLLRNEEQATFLHLSALRTISNLCSRPGMHVEDLMNCNLIEEIFKFMRTGSACQQDVAGWSIANLFSDAKALTFVKPLIDIDMMRSYGNLLELCAPALQRNLLLGLCFLSDFSMEEQHFAKFLEDAGIMERAERLQFHAQEQIAAYATHLVDVHEKMKR